METLEKRKKGAPNDSTWEVSSKEKGGESQLRGRDVEGERRRFSRRDDTLGGADDTLGNVGGALGINRGAQLQGGAEEERGNISALSVMHQATTVEATTEM
ncbi:unnamed protein product [Ilex paraguariensis]|uniref:Uncharacterized protein n=1 Tax=Ilex paraguariensis TaxID=185542 RepID=A0ABC8RX89_9AQUA